MIKSERDAERFLALLLEADLGELDAYVAFRFENFPGADILFRDSEESTLTGNTIEMLSSYQRAIYRSYSVIVYGEPSGRRLTDSEREALQIRARVSPGSTDIEFDAQEIGTKILEEAVGKLTHQEAFMLVVILLLLLFGRSMFFAWLKDRRERAKDTLRDQEHSRMSEHSNRLAATIRELAERNWKVDLLQLEATPPKEAILKAVASRSNARVFGTALSQTEASALSGTVRRRSISAPLTGKYQILVVDQTARPHVRVKVKRKADGLTFFAFLPDSLPTQERTTLINAEWNGQLVILKIRGRRLGESVVAAVIESVG